MLVNHTSSQTDLGFTFDYELLQEHRRTGRYCDLCIQSTATDSKFIITCHKIVLVTISPFFNREFGKEPNRHVYLEGVIDYETLRSIIDYIYSGGIINLTPDTVFKVFAGATKLMLQHLERTCMDYIKSLVSVEKVIKVLQFAQSHSCEELTDDCLKFISEYFQKVKEHGLFDLDAMNIKLIVERQIQQELSSPEDILTAVTEWLHKTEGRKDLALFLIKDIPLAKIDLKVLRKLLREDTFIQNIPGVFSLYVDAVEEIGLKTAEAQVTKTNKSAVSSNKEGHNEDNTNATLEAQASKEEGASETAVVPNADPMDITAVAISNTIDSDRNVPKLAGEFAGESEKARGEKRKATYLDTTEEECGKETQAEPEGRISKRGRGSTGENVISNTKSFKINGQINGVPSMKTDFGLSTESRKKLMLYFLFREHAHSNVENSVVSFNLETKELEIVRTHPRFDINTSLIYHKNKIYTLGGLEVRNLVKYNYVEVLNVLTKAWETNAPNHMTIRKAFRPIVLGEYLYTVGGFTAVTSAADVERLNLVQTTGRKWESVEYMPNPLSDFGVCAAHECLYVVGGSHWTKFNKTHRWISAVSNTFLCFNPAINRWIIKKPMPTGKRGPAVAVVGQCVYALGGIAELMGSDKTDIVASVYVYDIGLDSWSSGVPMMKRRHLFSAVVHDSFIYAIGGDSKTSPTVERFNVERQLWEDMGPLPTSGFYHSVGFSNE